MGKLLKVIKVEIRTKTTETVIKSKRHDYVRGGYKIEEVIHRTTASTPYALLECGHWQREHNYGAAVSTAKRLSCHDCENAAWEAKRESDKAADVPSVG